MYKAKIPTAKTDLYNRGLIDQLTNSDNIYYSLKNFYVSFYISVPLDFWVVGDGWETLYYTIPTNFSYMTDSSFICL